MQKWRRDLVPLNVRFVSRMVLTLDNETCVLFSTFLYQNHISDQIKIQKEGKTMTQKSVKATCTRNSPFVSVNLGLLLTFGKVNNSGQFTILELKCMLVFGSVPFVKVNILDNYFWHASSSFFLPNFQWQLCLTSFFFLIHNENQLWISSFFLSCQFEDQKDLCKLRYNTIFSPWFVEIFPFTHQLLDGKQSLRQLAKF